MSDVRNLVMTKRVLVEFFVPDLDCFVDIEAFDKCNGHRIPFDSSKVNGAATALEEFTRDKVNFSKVMLALAKSVSVSAEVPLV